jgi:hypothetical protein
MMMKSFCLYFWSYLSLLLSDFESEFQAGMDKVFRFDSGYCPLVATAQTIQMPSLLDTKNPSNMRIPLECHLTLYDTVDCIVDSLPLEDLPIVGYSRNKAKAMMHGDEGIGVDGLKELDPGPYTHDGIHIDDDIMEHGPSPIHYELVPLLPVMSNHVISAFQQGHQAIPLFKLKDNDSNALDHA